MVDDRTPDVDSRRAQGRAASTLRPPAPSRPQRDGQVYGRGRTEGCTVPPTGGVAEATVWDDLPEKMWMAPDQVEGFKD